MRWRWVTDNPIDHAEPPAAPAPRPNPPTAAEAARLLTEAWKDPEWGTLVWLAMVTGARRGELCSIRWSAIDLDRGSLVIGSSVAQVGQRQWIKDTKTHQQRRIALDAETCLVLAEHRVRYEDRMAHLALPVTADAFVFSIAPDNTTNLVPDAVTQRYQRMAKRLGIDTHLHALRHYSATELVGAGVDIRTIAGRLGHAGGGSTTLRVYSAWLSEADQRAAEVLAPRMPTRPTRS